MQVLRVVGVGRETFAFICLSFIMIYSLIGTCSSQGPATVRVNPPEVTVQTGSSFDIDIEVVDVIDLYRFSFQLSFNPSLMECVNAAWGPFLLPMGPPPPPPAWNNVAGTVSGMISLAPPELVGRHGSGTLVDITFECKGAGTSGLVFDYTYLYDSLSGPIPHLSQGGSVIQTEPTIEMKPADLTVWTCDNFTINMTISGVVDLASWALNITFDPAKMECLSFNEGSFLKQVGMTTFTPPVINNTAGTIKGANCTANFSPGVSGSGVLANMTFHCKSGGDSALTFSYTRLLNSAGNDITHIVAGSSVSQLQRTKVTFRLLAVEHYFDGNPMKSGQYLIQSLKSYWNWQNKSLGAYSYTSYIHLLSYHSDALSSPYYRGTPTNANVVNEITNFLGATAEGEDNNLTVRIFYYIGHSGKRQFVVWPIPTPCPVYMCLGASNSHPQGETGYQELYGEQLDAVLTSGDLKTSNCTVVILDTCYSGGYLNASSVYQGLNHPGRVVFSATDAANLACGWFNSPNVEDDWGWFSGHPNAKYNDNTVFGSLGVVGGLHNASDGDSDGWRSAGEVFEFANKTTRWYSANQSSGHSSQSWMKKMYPQACYGVAGADVPLVLYKKWLTVSQGGQGNPGTITPTPFSCNGKPLFKRSLPSSPWQMFRLNAQRTGVSEVDGPSSSSSVWSTTLSGSVYGSPVISDQMVFVCSNASSSTIYALDLTTGDSVWSYTVGGSICSSPAVWGGTVFVGTIEGGGTYGKLYALEEYTGLLRWNFTTPSGTGGIYASPAVDQGFVYIATLKGGGGGGRGIVYSLNSTSGEKLWQFLADGSIKSCVAIADSKVFVTTMDGGGGGGGCVHALNEFTGLPIWPSPFETDGAVWATPAVADGIVFVASMGPKGGGIAHMYALDEYSGTPLWPLPSELIGSVTSSPAVDSSRSFVVVATSAGLVYCLHEMAGEPLWITSVGAVNMSSPAVSANGYVYVGSTNSYVYCLDETNGDEVWSYSVEDSVLSSPTLTEDHVLVGAMDGKVVCLGPAFSVYNVAVMDVDVSYGSVFQGGSLNITCMVYNKGNVPATFNLTIGYSNVSVWTPPSHSVPTEISRQLVTLDPSAFTYVTCTWVTTGVPFGDVVVSATAAPIAYEVDTADNALFDGTVFITVPGDVTGPLGVPDGAVDVYDLAFIGKNFGKVAPVSEGVEYIYVNSTRDATVAVSLGTPVALCFLAFFWKRKRRLS